MQAIPRFGFTMFQTPNTRTASPPPSALPPSGADTIHFGKRAPRGDAEVQKILDSYLSIQKDLAKKPQDQQITALKKYAAALAEVTKAPLSHRTTEVALLLAQHLISRMFFLQNAAKLKEMGLRQFPSISAFNHQIDAFSAVTEGRKRKMLYRVMSGSRRIAQVFGLDMADVKAGKLNAAAYQTLQALHEQLELTADEQARVAKAHMDAIETAMQKTAAEIDPNRNWKDIAKALENTKVEDVEQLRSLVEHKVKDAHAFVQTHHLSGIPLDAERLIVTQSTKTLGEGNLAHYVPGLDLIGVQRKESANSLHKIPVIAVHEGTPGHWLQTNSDKPSAFPELETLIPVSRCFLEGWATYAQKLMLEQGFMSDPKERLATLGLMYTQARDALTVAQLLTGQTSVQQLEEEYLRTGASMDRVKAGIKNLQERPFLLSSYFLGMTQILQLREQVKAKEGRNFSLQKFHDKLLSAGPYPIPTLASALFNVDLQPLTAMSQAEINRLYN